MYFENYYWSKGRPKGVNLTSSSKADSCIKIVTDAYFKRYVVEKYISDKYVETLYDSALLDFRRLDPKNQLGWQKEPVAITKEKQVHNILDLEERRILVETSYFTNGLCLHTLSHHPQGTLVCSSKLFYQSLGAPFTGVILFDRSNSPIAIKEYSLDEEGNFSELLYENWECNNKTIPERFLSSIHTSSIFAT